MKLNNKTIVFLGDSITAGTGATDHSKSYVGRIANNYQTATVYNFGVGGTRIAVKKVPSEKPNYDYNFIERAALMPDADLVAVFGGTNDYGHGDALFGCMSDRTADTFYGALHVLFSMLVKKYIGKKIVIFTPLHRSDELIKNFDGRVFKDYVEAIREVAEFYSLPVLDLYKVSGMQPMIDEVCQKYMPDGLHPNDDGYELLSNIIIDFFDNL